MRNLPRFCKQFFIGIEYKTASRTRIAYAYDLGCFFDYLHKENPLCKKMEIVDFPLSILDQLKPMDIEEYFDHNLFFGEYIHAQNLEKSREKDIISID